MHFRYRKGQELNILAPSAQERLMFVDPFRLPHLATPRAPFQCVLSHMSAYACQRQRWLKVNSVYLVHNEIGTYATNEAVFLDIWIRTCRIVNVHVPIFAA